MFQTHRLSGWLVALALLASTPVVFHPVVFSGYTLSQNPYAADMGRGYVDEQLPSWKLEGGARTEGRIRYWPRGLTPALVLSALGLVALGGLGAFLRRGSASAGRGAPRPPPTEIRQEAA